MVKVMRTDDTRLTVKPRVNKLVNKGHYPKDIRNHQSKQSSQQTHQHCRSTGTKISPM